MADEISDEQLDEFIRPYVEVIESMAMLLSLSEFECEQEIEKALDVLHESGFHKRRLSIEELKQAAISRNA